ncbi:efflux RND transporter periplasmic adaptor subunit [Anaerolineales bacterium HSG6]|nr:efflux RND transporter periplasmic adaptor subunit [Anaerolineales bacterium HSG6]MDM8532454.1 efflux RND transporter periplasmic adaptor subunit [Anaerolineales bacterium HSG25]
MKRVKFLLWSVLLATTWLTIACGTSETTGAPQAQSERQVAQVTAVEVATVETGEIASIFNYSGNINPKASADIVPKVSGEIKEILVKVGDEVKAGDPIAIIDDELLQIDANNAGLVLKAAQLQLTQMELGVRPDEIAAARASVQLVETALNDVTHISDDERTTAVLSLAQAQAQLRQAQAEYDKIAWADQVGLTPQALQLEQSTAAYEASLASYNLQTNPSASTLAPLEAELVQARLNLVKTEAPFLPIEFEMMRNQIAQAEVAVEKTNLQVGYATVVAPFDGFIESVDVEIGALVSSQSSVAGIISKALEVGVDVEESRFTALAEGLPASLMVSAYPGREFPAVVNEVPPVADSTTHTFALKITPLDEDGLLRGGMFADVSILAEQRTQTLLVPRAAVTLVDNQPVIFVVVTQKTEMRPIVTGLRDRDRIEILSGLEAGETVITLGQDNLVDGASVQVIN